MEGKASYLSVSSSLNNPIDSKRYFKKALQHAGRNPSEEFINKTWEKHSSTIHYKEYCEILERLESPARDDILRIFKLFDKNNDGFISHSELKDILTSQGEAMTEGEVDVILRDADTNNDGKLDYSEFCTAMLSTCHKCQQENVKTMKVLETKKTVSRPSSSKLSIRRNSRAKPSRDENTSIGSTKTPKVELGGSYVTFKCAALSQGKLVPRAPKGWNRTSSKGCFYLDNDDGSVTTHEYLLKISAPSEVWLSIKPYQLSQNGKLKKASVDTSVLLFREASTHSSKLDFVGVANLRKDSEYCWKGDLRSGSYVVVPFTTGCRLTRRKKEPRDGVELIRKDQNGEIQLSKSFTETLSDMFDICDLDGNGLLNREEFNWFQLLTCDEEVDDEAWNIVVENFEMQEGELTKKGFIQLHLLQGREENAEPVAEFLDTLLCMGYNKALDMDQACPFQIDIYAAKCTPELLVNDLKFGPQNVDTEDQLIASILQMGKLQELVGLPKVEWHVYRDNGRISFVLSNKSTETIAIQIKYANMINCVSTKRTDNVIMQLHQNSSTLVDHFVALDESSDWSLSCSIGKHNPLR